MKNEAMNSHSSIPAFQRKLPAPLNAKGLHCFNAPLALALGFQLVAMAAWSQPAATNAAPLFANSDCLGCHLDPSTTRTVNGKIESLVFPTNDFAHSVHANLNCVDCHTGVKDLVHDPLRSARLRALPRKGSAGLRHEHSWRQPPARRLWRGGIAGIATVPTDILPVKDRASPVFKLNLPYTCAKCHSNPGLDQEYEINHPKRRRNTWKASTARRC